MITGIENPSFRKRTGYHAALLGGIAMLTSAVLAISNLDTADDIAQRLAEDLQASLAQVVPDALHDNNLLDNVVLVPGGNEIGLSSPEVKVYQALKDHKVTAVAYQVVTHEGYSGTIVLIMGIADDGTILGVRVISHAETPGLGDKIEEKKTPWILSFNGLSQNNPGPAGWHVKKDGGQFDQFSGATITPRAVVKAVAQGLQFFHDHRAALMGADHPKTDSPAA